MLESNPSIQYYFQLFMVVVCNACFLPCLSISAYPHHASRCRVVASTLHITWTWADTRRITYVRTNDGKIAIHISISNLDDKQNTI